MTTNFPVGRTCLSMQGTQIWSLVQKDSTSCRATKPLHLNYWAHATQLVKPACLERMLHETSHPMRSPGTATRRWSSLATTTESLLSGKEDWAQPKTGFFLRKTQLWFLKMVNKVKTLSYELDKLQLSLLEGKYWEKEMTSLEIA